MASNAALNRRRRSGQADGRPKPEARTEVLEVGEADRRLDALIEEEQRAKAAGPRRSMSTPPLEGPRGAPIALSLGFPGSQGREVSMSTGCTWQGILEQRGRWGDSLILEIRWPLECWTM